MQEDFKDFGTTIRKSQATNEYCRQKNVQNFSTNYNHQEYN